MNPIEPEEPLETSGSLEPSPHRDVALPETVIEPVRCKNCDAVLLGRFCVNCSQAADVHVPSTMELVHDLLEGLTHSDSRLWRTLLLLWFKPGKLTQEFVAGRRAAYLPPFRLYLILSIIFFLIASFMHTNAQVINFDDGATTFTAPGAPPPPAKAPRKAAAPATTAPSATASPPAASPPSAASSPPAAGAGHTRVTSCEDINFITFQRHPEWNQRIKHACAEIVRDNGENLFHVFIGTMSKAMFIFLPLVAFLHMLLYWRPRYRYAEHLLFFIHLHAFYFSVAILMVSAVNLANAWPALSGVAGVVEALLGWCLPVYTLIAMRRVFQRGWPGTVFKAVLLFVVYSIVFILTLVGVVVYAILQL
jgi:Protein of unknown function (DUF3667)